ncbi:MAG: type II toxin-antitoxin system antitoxin SocA domain-containing protein [Candidatus Taylorbacteria bacterium]
MFNKYVDFISSLRKERGFSQLEIAGKLNISRSSYIAFEQGRRELTLAEASELGKIFDISLEEIKMGTLASPTVIIEKKRKSKKHTVMTDKIWERVSVPQEKAEKFKQALLYILSKIGGKPNIGQTVLYKILYFIDFDYYEKYEEQLIGARYIRNTHGPTPVAFSKIVFLLEKEGKLETVKSKFYKYEQTKYLVNPDEALNLSKLSGQEIAHIDWEINRFSDFTAKQISALSHKDTPWLIAKEKEQLDYEYVFYRPEETSVREYEPL